MEVPIRTFWPADTDRPVPTVKEPKELEPVPPLETGNAEPKDRLAIVVVPKTAAPVTVSWPVNRPLPATVSNWDGVVVPSPKK